MPALPRKLALSAPCVYTFPMISDAELHDALRRYWGYESFLPLQQRIVRSLLAGHDTCVIMPTGGGKSLCYQLPAALSPQQTVIVVSPLIALMQDQVAQLTQMGIPSALLNSSLRAGQQAEVMRNAVKGDYRLLYLSPERVMTAGTTEWLQKLPVAFFAIDEAHCISEWGHEFRPEYRQLSSLRQEFADRAIAAFTASATRRVRHDIIEQLQLRDAHKYIASFHRPNLRYIVKQCAPRTQPGLLLTTLRKYSGSNVIVYAPTIARVEQTVDFLAENGIPAVPYHGQMDTDTRRLNQERWMSDEVRVLVGTIAFGLGINKTAVRAVIHLSMPKSIEQYYQEAGRAGRDGQPSDCILLWQKRDAGLLVYFIEQITDADEKERAWERYHIMRRYLESKHCRHRQICLHFGETPKWSTCGACDVCGSEPEWLSVAEEPQGLKKHRAARTIPALVPPKASAPPPLTPSRPQGPEMAETGQQFEALYSKVSSRLDPPRPRAPEMKPYSLLEPDPELREYLREWRREKAKEQGLRAFLVMHDASLDELCRIRPRSVSDFRGVYGFGERKIELYGRQILDALERFRNGARASTRPEDAVNPVEETMRLLAEGRRLEEIARIRGRQLGTIIGMVADLVQRGQVEFQPAWVEPEKQARIEAACAQVGMKRLKPIREALPADITYHEIQLVVASLRCSRR